MLSNGPPSHLTRGSNEAVKWKCMAYAKAFQITSVEEKRGIDEFAALDLNLHAEVELVIQEHISVLSLSD